MPVYNYDTRPQCRLISDVTIKQDSISCWLTCCNIPWQFPVGMMNGPNGLLVQYPVGVVVK